MGPILNFSHGFLWEKAVESAAFRSPPRFDNETSRVLDLFAGSGIVGLESASRGAGVGSWAFFESDSGHMAMEIRILKKLAGVHKNRTVCFNILMIITYIYIYIIVSNWLEPTFLYYCISLCCGCDNTEKGSNSMGPKPSPAEFLHAQGTRMFGMAPHGVGSQGHVTFVDASPVCAKAIEENCKAGLGQKWTTKMGAPQWSGQ